MHSEFTSNNNNTGKENLRNMSSQLFCAVISDILKPRWVRLRQAKNWKRWNREKDKVLAARVVIRREAVLVPQRFAQYVSKKTASKQNEQRVNVFHIC